MPTLNVRDVPKPVYDRLRKMAERDKRSLSQQVLWILERFIQRDGQRDQAAAEAWQGAEGLRENARQYMAALTADEIVKLIREDRDR